MCGNSDLSVTSTGRHRIRWHDVFVRFCLGQRSAALEGHTSMSYYIRQHSIFADAAPCRNPRPPLHRANFYSIALCFCPGAEAGVMHVIDIACPSTRISAPGSGKGRVVDRERKLRERYRLRSITERKIEKHTIDRKRNFLIGIDALLVIDGCHCQLV